MKYLFSKENLAKLRSLSHSDTLFAFDFDGTLSGITRTPSESTMSSQTLSLLGELATKASTAIVSGRSIKNLKSKLPVKLLNHSSHELYLIGNHGIEGAHTKHPELSKLKTICRNWKKSVTKFINLNGLASEIEIEDKNYSLSIHYRGSKHKTKAKKLIVLAVQNLHPVPRIVLGKSVFNILPTNAPNKGTALLDTVKQTRVQNTFYIGDDITDEDVFSLQNKSIFTVRVGKKTTSKADYFIKRQSEINHLLKVLLSLD